MPISSKSALLIGAASIRNETADRANTAVRVGDEFKALIDAAVLEENGERNGMSPGVAAATNTTALQAAINGVATGGTVRITQPGTYDITNITLDNGKTLRGARGVVLRWAAAASATGAMLTLSGQGCEVHDIEFDGNRSNQAVDQEAIETSAAPDAWFSGCEFHDFRARCIVSDVASSPRGLVESCRFYDCGETGVICDTIVIRSPNWTVSDTWVRDIDDGHCVRLGLFNGDATTTPVTGTVIKGCHFLNTNHNGVTCEIYAQNTIVTACEFVNLEQAIKAEPAGSTVWGITFTDNYCSDIAISTAFNLQVPKVTFSKNRCYDCGGGVLLSTYGICTDNYLENVGEAAANGSIVAPGGCIVTGNQIFNAPFVGIRISGAGNIIGGNQIDGNSVMQIGINITSATTLGQVKRNRIINQTGNAISFTSNASFETMQVKENFGSTGPLTLTIVKTIAAGVIGCPLSEGTFTLATEGGAGTDDLDTITVTPGIQPGHSIVLRPNTSTQDPTIKHATGNMHLDGAADFAMTDSAHKIALQWSGTFWQELWRSTT